MTKLCGTSARLWIVDWHSSSLTFIPAHRAIFILFPFFLADDSFFLLLLTPLIWDVQTGAWQRTLSGHLKQPCQLVLDLTRQFDNGYLEMFSLISAWNGNFLCCF